MVHGSPSLLRVPVHFGLSDFIGAPCPLHTS
jgi:hypothetical protein